MVNHEIVRALRKFLDYPVPESGTVALLPLPLTYAELIACGLINRAVSTSQEANGAVHIIGEMLSRADEYDVAHLDG